MDARGRMARLPNPTTPAGRAREQQTLAGGVLGSVLPAVLAFVVGCVVGHVVTVVYIAGRWPPWNP